MSPIVTTPDNLKTYKLYIKMQELIERYLADHGYLKLDLPVLLPALIPESYLEVFATKYRYMDTERELYLTPSPELMIKRLLSVGIGDCYYLAHTFRNSEPSSSRHSGEFTMLEMYKTHAGYMDMADVVLEMLQAVSQGLTESRTVRSGHIEYQGQYIDLSRWEKISVAQAFERFAGISHGELFDHARFTARAKEKGYTVNQDTAGGMREFSYEELWSQIYANEIEPHLGMGGYPTLIYDYPVEFAALSKPNGDGLTAQRFECYIAGIEIGNCYSELTDWQIQERRLRDEEQARARSGRIPHVSDWGFVDALKHGLPESAGIAMGVERLGMLFANCSTIHALRLIDIEL